MCICPLHSLKREAQRTHLRKAWMELSSSPRNFCPMIMWMYGWAGKQGRVYSPLSWVSFTISESNGIDCAPTIDLHKTISALYHLLEWLFSIRATADDCFQWERLRRIKREGRTEGGKLLWVWLCSLVTDWCRCIEVHNADSIKIVGTYTRAPGADDDCRDKVGIKVTDVVRCCVWFVDKWD